MTDEPFIPHLQGCEAMVSWPDDNVSECRERAVKIVRDPNTRQGRYVCAHHGNDLEEMTGV